MRNRHANLLPLLGMLFAGVLLGLFAVPLLPQPAQGWIAQRQEQVGEVVASSPRTEQDKPVIVREQPSPTPIGTGSQWFRADNVRIEGDSVLFLLRHNPQPAADDLLAYRLTPEECGKRYNRNEAILLPSLDYTRQLHAWDVTCPLAAFERERLTDSITERVSLYYAR